MTEGLLDWLGLPQLGGLLSLVMIAGALELARRAARHARVTTRLFADRENRTPSHAPECTDASSARPLARWLLRAGHRAPHAEKTFLIALSGSGLVGILLVWGLRASGAPTQLASLISGLPVLGAGISSVVALTPWIAGIAVAGLPIWLVRRDRTRRVEAIEQDLPLVLELLATLAEAGLGFESAVGELLRAQPVGRPLADELRLYQLEVSTGARRSESLRRLARRADLPSVSSFTSALAHGEETGASIAGLLRPQATLVRQRRRERALAAAESLPEKLVVPLLIGFLPGLLVWTLGPAFFQLFEMIDAAFG